MSLAHNTLFPNKVFISVDEAATAGFFSANAETNERFNFKVFDIRFDLGDPANHGRNQYLKHGHIPNAIFINLDAELSACVKGKPERGRHPLPTTKDLKVTLLKAGLVGNGNTEKKRRDVCLCYDDQYGGLAAARMWWMLNNLGIEVYILDGGIQLYDAVQKECTLPTSISSSNSFTSADSNKPSPYFPANVLPPLDTSKNVISAEIPVPKNIEELEKKFWTYGNDWTHVIDGSEVKRIYFDAFEEEHSSTVALPPKCSPPPLYVDARFGARFHSKARAVGPDSFPSHIPNSINRPWNLNIGVVPASACTSHPPKVAGEGGGYNELCLADKIAAAKKIPRVLPRETLRSDFEKIFALGHYKHSKHYGGRKAVFGCASGVTACMNIAVATHAGLVENKPKAAGTKSSHELDEGKFEVYLYAGSWGEIEHVNRAFLVDKSHKKYGFRLHMVKKVNPPAKGAEGPQRVTNPSTQLKIIAASSIPVAKDGVAGYAASIRRGATEETDESGLPRPKVPRMDPRLVEKVAKHIFVGEIVDVFVKTEGRNGKGEDELVGRIEAVPEPEKQRTAKL